jgi:hypothetical protein
MTLAKPNWRLRFPRCRAWRFAAAFAPGKWFKRDLTLRLRLENAHDSESTRSQRQPCVGIARGFTIVSDFISGATQCGSGHW